MDSVDLGPLLEQLDDNIDDLEEILETLLQTKLSDVTKTFPLLDKAKLHVLITYTIESLLFSYLRLHGVKAKEHPVFTELTRVKQYFAKIQAAETGPTKRENLSLNKQAAGRIIKHALAGNDKYDLERAEQQAKERATAQLKLRRIGEKRKAAEVEVEVDDESEGTDSGVEVVEPVHQAQAEEAGDSTAASGGPPPSIPQRETSLLVINVKKANGVRNIFHEADQDNIVSIDRTRKMHHQVKFATLEEAQAAFYNLPTAHRHPSHQGPWVRWTDMSKRQREAAQAASTLQSEEPANEAVPSPASYDVSQSRRRGMKEKRQEKALRDGQERASKIPRTGPS